MCVFFLASGTHHQTCSTKSISCTEEPIRPDVCLLGWVEGKVTSLGLLAKAAQGPTGHLCHTSIFLAHSQLGIHQDLQIFPCQAAFWPAGPWHANGPCLLRRRNCFFHLLNVVVSLTALFSSLLRFPWVSAHPPGLSSTPLSLVSFVRRMRVPSVPSRNLIQVIN